MKKRTISILLALTMAVTLLPLDIWATDRPVYLALGDSISTGYGLEGYEAGTKHEGAFPSLLVEGLEGYDLVNMAEDGETTASLLAKINANTDGIAGYIQSADVITLTIGGNDMMNLLYAHLVTKFTAINTLTNSDLPT